MKQKTPYCTVLHWVVFVPILLIFLPRLNYRQKLLLYKFFISLATVWRKIHNIVVENKIYFQIEIWMKFVL